MSNKKVIFTGSFLSIALFSCGGGGGISSNSTNSQPPSQNETLSYVQPKAVQTSNGVLVIGEEGNKTLQVFVPNAILVQKNNSNNRSLEDEGFHSLLRIPYAPNSETFEVNATDPDWYDSNLFIGFKSKNKDLDFTGAYDPNNATLIDESFDEFNNYFKVSKNETTNVASLKLNFGNKVWKEGESDTIVVGAWDNLNEGFKYSIPIEKDDVADVKLGNDDSCPYDFDESSGKIYLPTRNDAGSDYNRDHCIPLIISPGADDSLYNDTTTVKVYEGNSQDPNKIIVENEVLNDNVSDVYNLTSNLNKGEERNLKIRITSNLGGNENKKSSKDYIYTLVGDPSDIVVKSCLTADLNATTCVPGPQNDPYNNKVIANTYTYVGDVDVDGDGEADFAKYKDNKGNVILWDTVEKYVIPSTGAKWFVWVDSSNSKIVNGRPYEIQLWKNGSVVKTYSTNNPSTFSKVYVLGNEDNLDNGKIKVVECGDNVDNYDGLGLTSNRLFNNYKSNVTNHDLSTLGFEVCKNNPTQ